MTAQDCRNVCLSVPIRTLALTCSVKLFELFTVPKLSSSYIDQGLGLGVSLKRLETVNEIFGCHRQIYGTFM